METVVGIDTDSRGWAAVVLNGEARSEYHKTGDRNVNVRRLGSFRAAREFFASLTEGSSIFCEEPLALQNGQTTRLLGLAAGAIWAAHTDFDLTWFWVDVSSWKRSVIGKGNASKLDIIQWFNQRGVKYDECLDLYDAHAIAFYGVQELSALSA